MAFTGFSAAGVDLLQLNRLQNSKEFYEEHKNEIKKLAITPFYELIEQMTPVMQQIDAQFVTVPSSLYLNLGLENAFGIPSKIILRKLFASAILGAPASPDSVAVEGSVVVSEM